MEAEPKNKIKKCTNCAPYGGLREAFTGLTLAEDVEISAGAELRQQTQPFRRFEGGVKRRQKRMVQHFEYFLFCPRSPFLITARQLPPVHHFRGEEGRRRRWFRRRIG